MTQAEIGDPTADGSLGNASFVDTVPLAIDASTFAHPQGVAIDRSVTPNRLYVSDTEHHRVLGWSDVDALADGTPADLVLGQPDFFSYGCNRVTANVHGGFPKPTPTLDMLCSPRGLAVDSDGSLYVVDSDNCRVVVFDHPFATDQVADRVLGDPGGDCDVAADRFLIPTGVTVDAADNVFVADTLNCRVLEYDGPLTATDLLPDRVFGQSDFTTRSCTELYFPESTTVDPSGRLFVGTGRNVVRYDAAVSSDTDDDGSVGSVTCNPSGETSSSTCGPVAVAADDAGRLYTGDAGNNRVLAFDTPVTIQQAARVFGQSGFTGNTTLFVDECNDGGPSADTLCTRRVEILPSGTGTYDEAVALALDGSGRLYVADGLNHRVLRYDTPLASQTADLVLGKSAMSDVRRPVVTVSGATAAFASSAQNSLVVVDRDDSRVLIYASAGSYNDLPVAVIGQPGLGTTTCNSGGLGAGSLCMPTRALVDPNGNLWISDTGNNRVLRYDFPWLAHDNATQAYSVPSTADAVYGQADFASNACGAGASGLCAPAGLAFDYAGALYVADSANNRIVEHQNPLADTIADAVLAQPDFATTTCAAGADGLCDPRGITVDANGRLWIADHGNNRVVAYDAAFANGGGADLVLGQGGSVVTTVCGAGAGGLCAPSDVALDQADSLLVADTGNHRVLEFDDPVTDSQADRILGQPDFATVTCNSGGVSAESLCSPTSVTATGALDALIVGDEGNRRVLRYDASYCVFDYVLDPTTRRQKGVSRARSTRLKIRSGTDPLAADDVVTFKDKLLLFEADGGDVSASNEPLLTLSTSAGTVMLERVPTVSNIRVTAQGSVWEIRDLAGELDEGVDIFRIGVRSVIPSSKPQFELIKYKGRAVGQDFSSFTETDATFRAQWGSTCFTTQLTCKTSHGGRICKPAR